MSPTTTHIDLPDDQSAEFRDPELVPERLRRPITRLTTAFTKPGIKKMFVDAARRQDAIDKGEPVPDDDADGPMLEPEDLDIMFELNDALVIALCESWSFERPIDLDNLRDLPGPTYDALLNAAAPSVVKLLPDFSVSPDPASPTEPSTV